MDMKVKPWDNLLESCLLYHSKHIQHKACTYGITSNLALYEGNSSMKVFYRKIIQHKNITLLQNDS